VLSFRSSDRLAGAYGVAVSANMALTTILFAGVLFKEWKWSLPRVLMIAIPFLILEAAFLLANLAKVPRGGWVPLAIAAVLFFVFITWRRGRDCILEIRQRTALPVMELVERVQQEKPCRTPGTGVFLTPVADQAPAILRQHLEHIHALHEQVILLSVSSSGIARVPKRERVVADQLPAGIAQVTARYGYMQSVAFADILAACRANGVCVVPDETTFYVARERVRPTGHAPMARWRKRIFIFLQRNTPKMQDFFDLPPRRVVELGTTIEL
jgi:KUP system potassium uptake protein